MIRFTPAILAFISVAQAVDIESKASTATQVDAKQLTGAYSGGPHLIDMSMLHLSDVPYEPNHAPYPNPNQGPYPNQPMEPSHPTHGPP